MYRRTAAAIIDDCGQIAVDSYVAGPKPTVQQCMEDVDSCEVFLGIIGLRYGWVPQDGDPRSITHREWDRAANKTRLMFLMTDKHADLAEPIAKFRNLIPPASLPVLFEGLDGFAGTLRKTLRERIGIEEPISPLLPFFCDRGAQYERVEDRLWERRMIADTRLRIFIVHADALQGGAQFVDVLRCKLRNFPATKDSGEAVSFELEWPATFGSASQFRDRIRQKFAEKVLRNRNAPIEEVERCLQGVSGPILIHTYVSTTEYERTGEAALTEFCRFWEEWEQLRRTQPVIVLLRVEYELPPANLLNRFWTPRLENSNRAIRDFFRTRFTTGPTCEVLDELPRIPVDDAIRWSRNEDVRRYLSGPGCEPRIREIYKKEFSREPDQRARMHPLAQELMTLLKEGA
jgi:hypothetical protein